MTDYRELRCQSAFSFLRGASLPEELVDEAARLGHSVLALGDRDGVAGAPSFFRAARSAGVRALVGSELTLDGNAKRKTGEETLYVLVSNRTGYRNLCRLVTRAKLRAPKGEGRVRWSDLEAHTEGLFCLAGGCDGPLAGAFAHRDPAAAEGRTERLRRLFGDRLRIDLQRHLDPREERYNRFLADVVGRFRIPLVATNDVRHATPRKRELLDVLTCIREKTSLDQAGRLLLPNAERHLKTSRTMECLFRDRPEVIRNTRDVAERCEFTLEDLGYRFPEAPLPPGETPDGHLHRLAFDGARRRYGRIPPKVRRQLEHELGIVARLRLAGYFLIVHDIVEFCRREGILAQGRGSAANSAVCYALGITAVDAVGMDLLFERFLSEERGEWPDIDIDLPSGNQREKVLQYVYRRYGPYGAGMTANVITYRARSAIREVGKALGLPAEAIDRLSKALRSHGYRDDLDSLDAQIRRGGLDPDATPTRHLLRLAGEIEGLPRHLGQHSGGMVIAAGRLDEIVPLEPARMPGRVVVQWDKDDCASLGIIKVDLLGLGMMAVLEDAIPLVREHEGIDVDPVRIPQDDPEVYRALQRADTIGVFQVESRAQMATLPRMKPECFYDLVVEVAIIRPGPIVGQMVHPYLERRAGREPIEYDHPLLEPILRRTLGVPIFQEQLLKMAITLAGFSPGEAEELRRAMGFKRSVQRMEVIERRLRKGLARNGITGEKADTIARSITSFALYGFPESHSASFALLAYASAYLKVHHPAAFLCAMLNNWPLGFYHPATLVKDAERHGVTVLPVDVTRSSWNCTLEKPKEPAAGAAHAAHAGHLRPHAESGEIFSDSCCAAGEAGPAWSRSDPAASSSGSLGVRMGLRYVRGLREAAGQRIERERAERPFGSLADFARRTGLRRDELDTLAHAGAFSAFGADRRTALWQVASVDTDPSGLLSRVEPAGNTAPLPAMTPFDATLADYETAGLTTGPHVMRHLRPRLDREGILTSAALRRTPNGRRVRVAGHVIVRQRPGSAKGFLFLTLEDETGTANAVVTPRLFERYRLLLHTAALLVVEGPAQNVDGVIHVRAQRFRRIPLAAETPASHDFR